MSHRIITDSDTFRSNIRNKIKDLFPDSNDSIKISNNLEIGVYNWALKEASNKRVVKKWDNPIFVQIYLDHLRSIYINLKSQNIKNLIYSGDIKPQDIAFMTHQELCPERWAELIKIKSIRDMNKYEQKIEAMTDIYKCRKCFSRQCSYYQLQTRSGDESMTVYISCIQCGNRWKN